MNKNTEQHDTDAETTVEERLVRRVNRLLICCANDMSFLKYTAIFLKRLHEELIAIGFSEEQATNIVSHYQIKPGVSTDLIELS